MARLEINAIAARGFQAGAGAYDRARPDYPADALRWLSERLAVSAGARVLDVGAGTGKLTALLVPSGAELLALEPVEAMRSRLAVAVPDARVVAGTAEAIPFESGSMDAAAVAQAFHWFDGPRALAELHRVLRPGGRLGLMWNVRDRSVDWVAELAGIVDGYGDVISRHEGVKWKAAFPAPGFGPLEEAEFPNGQSITPAGVLDRVSSTSFIAVLPEAERADVLDRVRSLLESHSATAGRSELTFPHLTRVYACERL